MHKGALYLDGPGGTGKTFVYRALCARLRRPGLIVIWVVSTGVDALFGGLPPVLGGDWAQTLPVVRNGSRTDVYRACLPATPIWKSPRKWTLTENMRIPDEILIDRRLQGFCEWVYPRAELARCSPELFKGRAILSARNESLAELNDTVLAMMPDEPDNPVQEYFAAHAVHRRFGAAADVAAHSESRHLLRVRLLSGPFNGNAELIPWIDLISSREDSAYRIVRKQSPVRVCFMMTINKA
ncbi:hypothetical protein VTN49DRAFT_6005 [Thermomyces lanuginosus]|uniref:uncharacterized protein n=1 Tax=Thermomyces lanuginosus TaxID=5541 RepID=UPI0037423214